MIAIRPFCLSVFALVCATALVRAEPPPPPQPPEPVPPPAAAPVRAGDVLPTLPETAFISLQLLAGQQSGIRGQYAFLNRPDGDWLLEGFYGATLTKITSSEAVGAGVRRNWRRQWVNDNRAIYFSTGVDVFYQFKNDGSVMVAPSVEVSYLRCFNEHGCGWEVGISGGVGVGVSGTGNGDRDAAGQVTPLISVFTGLRF